MASYLSGRDYFLRLGADSSEVLQMLTQGSVLGPLFFILYTADLIELIRSQNLQPHLYADDSQLYGSCRPGDTLALTDRVTRCVDLVASWKLSNQLCLSDLGFDVNATTSASGFTDPDQRLVSQSRPESWRVQRR